MALDLPVEVCVMDDMKILETLSEVEGVYGCAFVDTKDLVFNPG